VLGCHSTSVVPQPNVVSRLAKVECKTIVIIGAVGASALQQPVDQKDRIPPFCTRARWGPALPATKDSRPALTPLLFWERCIFLGIVDMPKSDDEAILGLDPKCLNIQSNSSRIVCNVADYRVLAPFQRWTFILPLLLIHVLLLLPNMPLSV
jgi:hypothetical protein